MRKILWFAILMSCFIWSKGNAQNRIEVIVLGVRDTTGLIRVGLFSDKASFLKKPKAGRIVKAVTGRIVVVFENVPSGSYAVSIIHDSNKNGILDSNFFGIPQEGFGFSNNVMGSFGPPSFDKAKFILSFPLTITLKIRYL